MLYVYPDIGISNYFNYLIIDSSFLIPPNHIIVQTLCTTSIPDLYIYK